MKKHTSSQPSNTPILFNKGTVLSFIMLFSVFFIYGQTGCQLEGYNTCINCSYSNLIDSSRNQLYSDTELAECYAQEALQLSLKNTDALGVGLSHKALGDVYMIRQDYFKSKELYLKAEIQLIQTKNFDKLALCRNNLGIVYRELGMFDKAIAIYLKNIRFYELTQELDRLVMSYNNIGIIYEKIADFPKALSYYRKALNLVPDPQVESKLSLLLNIGVIHDLTNTLDSAECYYLRVIDLATEVKVNDPYLATGAYSNLSAVYAKQGDLNKAKIAQLEGMKLEKSQGIEHSLSYTSLANIYYKLGQYESSLSYALKAREMCLKSGSRWNELSALDILIKIYRSKGDYKNAVDVAVTRNDLKDTLLTRDNLEKLRKLEVLHEVEKKNYENSLLESEVLIKDQKLNLSKEQGKRQRVWVFSLVLLLIGALTVLFVLFKRNKLKKELIAKERVLHEKETIKSQLELKNERLEKENIKAKNSLTIAINKQLVFENDGVKRELVSNALLTTEKNEILTKINELLDNSVDLKTIKKAKEIIKNNLDNDSSWEVLKLHFDSVHPDFFIKLNTILTHMTQLEQKHCAYIKLKISNKEVAQILNVELKSVQMAHYRLKKKLDLSENQTLRGFIDQL